MDRAFSKLVSCLDRYNNLSENYCKQLENYERHSSEQEWYSGLSTAYSQAAVDLAKTIEEIFVGNEELDVAI